MEIGSGVFSRVSFATNRALQDVMFPILLKKTLAQDPIFRSFHLRTSRTSTAATPPPCARTIIGLISMSER